MEFKIGDYVEIKSEDDYCGIRGFILEFKNGWFLIDCANKQYPYYIHMHDTNEKMIKIV